MIFRRGTVRTGPPARRLGLLTSAAVLSVAVLGVILGSVAFGHSTAAGGPGKQEGTSIVQTVRVGPAPVRRAPTSFGSVAASGMQADIASPLYGKPMATVRIVVTLTSRLGRPLLYSPGQFRLRAHRGGGTITPIHTGGLPRTLRPHARARAELSYLIPQVASGLELEFDDLERREPVRLQLGALVVSGRAPTSHTDHHTSG